MNKKTLEMIVDDRKFPAYSDQQGMAGESSYSACMTCTSTVCCTGPEGPISLSAFDILRYSVAFNMSPSDFMSVFTQDRFPDDTDGHFRARIESPTDSTVTYIRRKKVTADSHCFFTKYVKDNKGRPRITCSLHEPRPLSCREFYFEHCRHRHTNELGVMVAAAMEALVDGKLNTENIDNEISILNQKVDRTVNDNMVAFTLREARDVAEFMKDESYQISLEDISEYQDPMGTKLKRLLNKKHLRYEEDYGYRPKSHQLDPNNFGLSLVEDGQIDNIINYVEKINPIKSEPVFPHYYGNRITLGLDIGKLKMVPYVKLEGGTDREVLYHEKMMAAFNMLIAFTSWYDLTETVLEDEPALLPVELFTMWSNMRTSKFLVDNYEEKIDEAILLLLDKNVKVMTKLETIDNYSTMVYYSAMLYYMDLNKKLWVDNEKYEMVFGRVEGLLKDSADKYLNKDLYSEKSMSVWTKKEQYTVNELVLMYDQTLNLRYFKHLGLLPDNSEQYYHSFYKTACKEILPRLYKLNITSRNVIDVYNLVTHIGYGLNQYGRYKLDETYAEMCEAINNCIWDLVTPNLKKTGNYDDIELISEFCDATHTNLGFSIEDERYLEVMDKVAKTSPSKVTEYGQNWEGIKEGEPKDTDEYLYTHLYHRGWCIVDAMRSYFGTIQK